MGNNCGNPSWLRWYLTRGCPLDIPTWQPMSYTWLTWDAFHPIPYSQTEMLDIKHMINTSWTSHCKFWMSPFSSVVSTPPSNPCSTFCCHWLLSPHAIYIWPKFLPYLGTHGHHWGEYICATPNCTFDKTVFQDAISNEDMTTFHGEDGIDDFAGGEEVKVDRSRSMKRSAIVQIGNAQQVFYLANWELMRP